MESVLFNNYCYGDKVTEDETDQTFATDGRKENFKMFFRKCEDDGKERHSII
jgi:hypothetical protein